MTVENFFLKILRLHKKTLQMDIKFSGKFWQNKYTIRSPKGVQLQ